MASNILLLDQTVNKGTGMRKLSAVYISICYLITFPGYMYADSYQQAPELAALSELGVLNGNYADIVFDGASLSKVHISQSRNGGLGNKAHVKQTGIFNHANLKQEGGNNLAYIEQSHGFNYASTTQTGNGGHESAIIQKGYGNVAMHIQSGSAQHKGQINQSGNGNLAYIKDTANSAHEFTVNQSGHGFIIINN